jgi:CBS-domain-containing membrane protein
MTKTTVPEVSCFLTLNAGFAADVMTANPLSICDQASVQEAVAFLLEKGISGAPVIDVAGRPVGVVTQTDLLVHEREKGKYPSPYHDAIDPGAAASKHLREKLAAAKVDHSLVRDVMTPIVFTVRQDTPVGKVIEDLLGLKVHRVFVVDDTGVLVGVVSALDVLRQLRYRRIPDVTR